MSMRLDDDELAILAGDNASRISHAAKLLYILGIRPHMDFETGLVGYKRRVSYQSLRELLEYMPVPGSRRRPETFTKDNIRSLLAELERANLIKWLKNAEERCLFFACLAADRGNPSKNRRPTGATPSSHPGSPTRSHTGKPSNGAGFDGVAPTHEPPEEPPTDMAEEPPTSGSPVNTTHHTRRRARERPAGQACMPACIPADAWAAYAEERQRLTGREMSLGQQLALWQELASMDAEGYDLARVLRRCVGHGFATFDRRPDLMKKPPVATNLNPGACASTQEPKRGHYGQIQDVDNSAPGRVRQAIERRRRERNEDGGGDEPGGVFEGKFERVAF